MFDIGFSEMMVIGVVALVVIGPERLPRVARTAGHLVGRFRRYVADVKSDIKQEIDLAEFKQMHADVKEAATRFETSVHQEVDLVNTELYVQAQPQVAESVASVPEAPTVSAPAIDPNQLDLFAPAVRVEKNG